MARRRITVRKSKRYPDFYEVVGGGTIIRTQSKSRAKEIAGARKRLRAKGRRI